MCEREFVVWYSEWVSDAFSMSKNTKTLHDIRDEVRSETLAKSGLIYLQHDTVELPTYSGKGWKIYGSPAAPRYAAGAFQYQSSDDAKGQRAHDFEVSF